MTRMFVAVTPATAALDGLAARWDIARRRLRSGRPTPVDGWHVTLEFLGQVDDQRQPVVRACLAAVAERAAPARLRIAGAGTFGSGPRKIVWAGLAGQTDRLTSLATAVRQATGDALGVEPDTRPYNGHLTLARDVRDARPALDLLRGYRGPSWTVDELQLFSSELGAGDRGSSHYTVLASWPLTGRGEDHDSANADHAGDRDRYGRGKPDDKGQAS
ncbi:RNA 2',3'-cyclic phosphodiesterase [Fodinicola acaciae]|uniref:RNA 2',3'-cyclic phosphodiesterase n=1 Tax=Fodinicola acaciae TaxID=2681555 RepID=UPI0013D1F7FE|nr:RNA 2',3'-cyclic phosphodiesterase [Fodinicola acaciae]